MVVIYPNTTITSAKIQIFLYIRLGWGKENKFYFVLLPLMRTFAS